MENKQEKYDYISEFIYDVLSKTDMSPIFKLLILEFDPYISTLKKAYFFIITLLLINTILLINIVIKNTQLKII